MAEATGIQITPESLAQTFQTYREQLIVQPMLAMQDSLQHMSIKTGIRYRETIGEMSGNFQLGNYKKDKLGDGNVNIQGRVFETFFGNCVEPIDPNSIYQSIWGSNITKGEALKNVPIVLAVCTYIMKKLGENLALSLWSAKHVSTNFTETMAFFNGFKTIFDNDIAGTNEDGKIKISETLGNLETLNSDESITKDNAEDVLKEFFFSRDKRLRSQNLKMFMSDLTYHAYTEAYQLNHGALPYNQTYDKKTLEGASNVEIVSLPNVPDDFLCLTPQNNMFVLFNQKSDDETYTCEKSLKNHYDVDFIANQFFGTQVGSVSPQSFAILEKKAAAAPAPDPAPNPGT